MTRTAVLAGATGAVGSEVLKTLLDDPDWKLVHSLVRRPSGTDDPKLIEHIVDFDALDEHVDLFADADVFCCIGSRATPGASGREAFRKVDYGYVAKLAELAAAGRARQFLLVSGIGTSPRSPIFYSRVKAEAEQAVSGAGLPAVQIFRPSLLLAPRPGDRPFLEIALQRLTPRLANLLLIGPLARYRPISTANVARHMVARAKAEQPGVNVHYSYS
ncbi:hypothetical protein MSIMFB_04324 [Mycobacterium simulans]|uniref:NAD(P)-binding domain-containing protein n=1 Tax=Mycobacterium simulans TaxID=627089 RepID=A0A7Z7ING5_9MYCO|nr:NAD(P)H-binding protein [Mycobacterium simulans]SOJ56847.1 hypothetical protein MSIMFB_04324 [Mycobacterium simulans]